MEQIFEEKGNVRNLDFGVFFSVLVGPNLYISEIFRENYAFKRGEYLLFDFFFLNKVSKIFNFY